MTAPLILAAFALAAALGGEVVLRNARWATRSPRAGIFAWQVLSTSVATAWVLALVSLALPVLPVRTDVARLMGITAPEIVEHYLTPVGHWLALVGLVAAVGLVVRLVWLLASALWTDRRTRARHADRLTLLARPHPDGFLVVDHPDAAVYCLPGRRRQVVVTSSALNALSTHQLALVLAHEQAHLRAHHQLPLVMADVLRRAFPLSLFAIARVQIATLAEMQADDSARSPRDRRDLARALLALADARGPVGALTAGGVAAPARARRLVLPTPTGLGKPSLATLGVATACLLALPWALALAPAAEAGLRDCCATPAPTTAPAPQH